MFSIICPIYNKQENLKATIESVLNQSFKNFQFICIDDGSNDKSPNIVRSFNDNRIDFFQNPNLGISATRNFGICKSKNDFIAFIDADDIWHKDYLLKMKGLISKYPNECAFVSGYSKIYKSYKEDVVYSLVSKNGVIDNYFESRIKGWGVHTSSVIIKKQLLLDIGGFPVLIDNYNSQTIIIDLNGRLLFNTPNFLKQFGKWVNVENNLIKKPLSFLKNINLKVSVPGLYAEDQYVWDNIAMNKKFVYTNQILSFWSGDVKNQATRDSNGLPVYPNLLYLLKYNSLDKSIREYKKHIFHDLILNNYKLKSSHFKEIVFLHKQPKSCIKFLNFLNPYFFKIIIVFQNLIFRISNKLIKIWLS
jgi:glycosyltransferase involved in cell wall biosynthesis